MTDRTKGILFVVGTSVAWGVAAPFARLVTERGLSQTTVMGLRAPLIAIFLFCFLCATRGISSMRATRGQLAAFAVLGFLTVVMNSTGYMQSCVLLTPPQAVMLHYTFPLFTMLGDVFITKERPTLMHFASGVLIIAGLYVGFADGDAFSSVDTMGVVWGMVSVIGSAALAIMTRTQLRDSGTDPIVQLFYTHLFGSAYIIAIASIWFGWSDLAAIDLTLAALLIYPIFINGMLGVALLFASLKYIPATLASLITSLEVVWALAAMPLLLGTSPEVKEVVGSAIILAAVCMSTIAKRPRSATCA